jgi:hypothetical protein
MVAMIVGIIVWLDYPSASPTSLHPQQHRGRNSMANKHADNDQIDGQWLWDEWKHLSTHDKKAIFALVESVTQQDFQVCGISRILWHFFFLH